MMVGMVGETRTLQSQVRISSPQYEALLPITPFLVTCKLSSEDDSA